MSIILIALALSIPAFLWFYAVIDILRNDFTGSNKVIWLLIALLVPALGGILYFLIGRKQKVAPASGIMPAAKITAIIALIITLPISGFVGLMVHTSMAQFSEYKMRGNNSAALSDLKNVRTSVEAYYMEHEQYPASVPADCHIAPAVTVAYTVSQDGKHYVITGCHTAGDKMFAVNSEGPQAYAKPKGAPDDAYQAL